MDVLEWAAVATIAQVPLILASLIYIALELRQNHRLASAANVNALTEQAAAFNALLFQHGDLADLWYGRGRPWQDLSTTDQRRYREMVIQWLIFHEGLFYQSRKGLLEREIYRAWQLDLEGTLADHNLEDAIGDIRALFPGPFGDHLANRRQAAETGEV